jgi:hypothetical protein
MGDPTPQDRLQRRSRHHRFMPTWPIFIEEWQFACCGTPFAVGETVAWQLRLIADWPRRIGWPDDMFVDVRAAEVLDELRPTLATAEGPRVGIELPLPGMGDVVHGALLEDHHDYIPHDLPTTAGVVRRIRVVTQRFERREGAMCHVPGTVRFRDVDSIDRRFGRDSGGRHTTGALVDLELLTENG